MRICMLGLLHIIKEYRRWLGPPCRPRAAPAPPPPPPPRTGSRYNHVGACLYTPVTTLFVFYWLFWSRWTKKCCSCFVFSYMQLYVLLYKNMFHQLNHMLSVRQPKNMLQQLNLTLFLPVRRSLSWCKVQNQNQEWILVLRKILSRKYSKRFQKTIISARNVLIMKYIVVLAMKKTCWFICFTAINIFGMWQCIIHLQSLNMCGQNFIIFMHNLLLLNANIVLWCLILMLKQQFYISILEHVMEYLYWLFHCKNIN